MPGLQDAHIHLLDGGTEMSSSAHLWDATSIPDLQERMADHAGKTVDPMVMGAGWQAGVFGDHNLTRQVLDQVISDRPAIVYDSSFHNACLNSAAIAMIGLTESTRDPKDGHFVRDASGVATGMLHEDAIYWARKRLPEVTDAAYLAGLKAGLAHANRHGITGIIDPAIKDYHLRGYAALDAAGELTLRVSGAGHIGRNDTAATAVERLSAQRLAHSSGDFRLNAAKFFFDGVLENRTAAMIEPYADLGGNAPLMFDPDQITEMFTALDAARFQIHVHAIGDMASRAALDGFEQAMRANGRWPSLHQIAHVQVLNPADIPRFASLGVMANTQPLWARHDPEVPDEWMAMVGAARLPQTYAFRQLLNAGAPYCLSSDWSVSTLNPFEIMETAVTRMARLKDGGKDPFLPTERLTVAEAILGYTVHAAAACWRGQSTGRLLPGFSADLVVLDRDIFACPTTEIGATEVMLTLFKGRTVWRDRRLFRVNHRPTLHGAARPHNAFSKWPVFPQFSACPTPQPPINPPAEWWPSGRRHTPAKGAGGEPSRGFESLPLRHTPLKLLNKLGQFLAYPT